MSDLSKCSLIQKFDYFLNQNSYSIFNSLVNSTVYNVVHFSKSCEEEKIDFTYTNINIIVQELESLYYHLVSVNMKKIDTVESAKSILFISNNSLNYKATQLNIESIHNSHDLGELKVFNLTIYNNLSKHLYVDTDTLSKISNISKKLYIILLDKLYETNLDLKLLESRLKMILFSTVVYSIVFSKNKNIRMCCFLNPFYPIEAGIYLAAKLYSLTTWFIPHGLPQKSHFINAYDILTPLTIRDQSWYSFNAKKFVYLPWSESRYVDKKYLNINSYKKINLLFFSQLSGASIHGLKSLEQVAKRFIFLASQNKNINQIKIRFRNKEEKDVYLKNSKGFNFIQFSIATEDSIQKDLDEADCIASCSSTAMLYAQACNIPSIHVYDRDIIDVWPYSLSSAERSIEIKYEREDFILINSAIDSVITSRNNNKMLYLENIYSNIDEVFKKGKP